MNKEARHIPRFGTSIVCGMMALAWLMMEAPALGQFSVTQPAGITISDSANAAPYPSEIVVSNVLGTIERVTVTLNGLTHGYPDDIDILLVGPDTNAVIVMSDAGLGFDLNSAVLTFDDTASAKLPDDAQIVPGAYKPSNWVGSTSPDDDAFGASAPSPPYSETLGVFANKDPNGRWRLFVRDDNIVDGGSIASGWTLNLYTTPTLTVATNKVATDEDTPLTINVTVKDSDTPANDLVLTAVSSDQNIVTNTAIVPGGSGEARTLNISPSKDANGTNTITIRVSDRTVTNSTDVTFIVRPVNDAPTIVLGTNRVSTVAGVLTTNVIAVVKDVDDDVNGLQLSATSSNTNVVANDNAFFTRGAAGTNTFTIAPVGAATGTATMTIQVSDGHTNNATATAPIDVTVNSVPHAIFANSGRIAVNDAVAATPYPSTLVVSNVSGLIGKVTVALADVTHGRPEDMGVLLVGPGGQTNVILMRFAGGANAISHARITFDDVAAPIPNTAAISTGSYSPNDYGTGNFDDGNPANPAPVAPYGDLLNVFNGKDANGTWRLYVLDQVPGQSGQINGGWLLNIFPAPTFLGLPTLAKTFEDTDLTVAFTVADFDGTVTNVTAISPNESLVTATTTLNGNNATVVLHPVADQFGTNRIPGVRVVATDSSGFKTTNSFELEIQAVNDAPAIQAIQRQVTRAGVPAGPVIFNVSDKESTAGSLTVRASSNNPKLLPNSHIVLGGSGGTRTVTLFPVGTQPGTANVTVEVSDGPLSSSSTFDLVVLEPGNPLFENANGIEIVDDSVANPYPSTNTVSGLIGEVAEVKVALLDITHQQPDDVDVLLIGPTGKKVVLMSDAGGTNVLNNVQLIFADSASSDLPDSTPAGLPILSGIYRPTDYEVGDVFPNTPTGAVDTDLSTFIGTNPNGNWRLYVLDDGPGPKGGTIGGGWQLSVRTKPSISAIPDVTTLEDTPTRVNVSVGDEQPGVNITLRATNFNTTLIESIVPGGTGASRTLTITPRTNEFGTNIVTVIASDGVYSSTNTFRLLVAAVDDAPSIVGLSDKSTPAGLRFTLDFTVTDPETANTVTIPVTAASSNQGLVSDANITISGTGINRTITILPTGVQTGRATISLTATDSTGQKSTATFVLTVTPTISFANSQRIEVRDATVNAAGTSDPYPSVINVHDVAGAISRVTVTLDGFSHPFPDDVDVLLVSPNGKKVMLMSDAGGGGPANVASNLRLTFRDDAAAAISAPTGDVALSSGIFRPADYEATDSLPAPAPPRTANDPYSTSLSTFIGASPNGDWKLYVSDDTFPDSGAIENGWFLILETAPSVAPIANQTTPEDTQLSVRFTLSDADTDPTNLVATATSSANAPANLVSNICCASTNALAIIGTGFDRTLVITPTTDLSGTNIITLSVTDGTATNSVVFYLTVTAVDDPPRVTTTTNVVTINEDTTTNIVYTIGDVDSQIGTTNVVVTSSNPTLVPTPVTNISVVTVAAGSTGPVTVTVRPATNEVGSTELTFTLTDRNSTVTNVLTLNVNPVNDPPFISSIGTQTVVAGNSTTNIAFKVGDVETPAKNLVVTATSSRQDLVPDSNIVHGGSGEDRTIQLTSIGTQNQTNTVTVSVTVTDGTASVTTQFALVVTPSIGSVFANTQPITIRDSNNPPTTGQPYPSTIVVSGVVGNVFRVLVTLDGFSHTAPDDVDVLLVSPGGQKVVLMSDAGGRNAVSNLRLTFDDTARGLPDESAILSGSYHPTDYGTAENFRTPAPAASYADSLAAFAGSNPNGTWSLYVQDDTANDFGSISQGWTLRIEPTPTISVLAPTPGTALTFPEDMTGTVSFTIGDQATPPENLNILAASSNATLLPPEAPYVDITRNGPNLTGIIRPATNQFGTNNLTLIVERSDGARASAVVPMSVTPVNDPPAISRLTQKTTDEGTPLTIDFFVTDVDTGSTNLTISASSGNPTIIASTNLLFYRTTNSLNSLPSNEVQLTMIPNPNQSGTARITITVTDKTDNAIPAVVSQFDLVVQLFNDPPIFASAIPTQSAFAGGFTTNIAFTVNDPDSTSLTVTGRSSDTNLVKNSGIVVNPVTAAPGNRTVQIFTEHVELTTNTPVTISLIVADNGSPSKSATNNFVLNIRPTRERIFSNTRAITIRDNNTAQDYPSVINVSGLAGTVARVTATLNGFTHRFPDDVDVLLVSPGGQKMILMSDAGGGVSVTNLVLTFDDGAAAPIGDTSVSTGTFKPANYEGTSTDNFVAPAPAGPYSSTLSAFNGGPANGDWSLYVTDDTPSDSGSISSGWSLAITTQPMIAGLTNIVVEEDTVARLSFTIAEESFASTDFTLSASSTNLTVVGTNGFSFTGTGTNRVLIVTPVANASGTTEITVVASNPDGQTVSAKFSATYTPVNDAPMITEVSDQTISAGSVARITFDFSDVETAKKDLVLRIESSNGALIPTNNIVLVGNELRIFPVGNRFGSSQITLTVTDQGNLSASTSFNVNVLSSSTLYANSADITVADNATAAPYPSTITVSNVSATVSKVKVTLAQVNHSFPDDLDVLLVGPQGQKVVLMSDAGGGAALTGVRLVFDDAATVSLPDNTVITNGTYKPSNYEGAETFPAPAPTGPYASALSAFNGTDPNGTWSLYVQDDASPDAGALAGGWLLDIITTSPTIGPIGDQQLLEDTTKTIDVSLQDSDTPLTNLVLTASVVDTNLLGVSLSGTGGTRSLTITPAANASGQTTVTLTVTDGTSSSQTTFRVDVTPVNDAPAISGLRDTNILANVVLTLPFTVSDAETAATNLAVTASSSNTGLGAVAVTGTGGARTLTFTPSSGSADGNTTVSVTASDGDLTTTNTFVIGVSPSPGPTLPQFASQTINEDSLLQVPFTVGNVASSTNLTVTASASNTNLVAGILLTGSGANRVALIGLVPNANGASSIAISARDEFGSATAMFTLTVSPVDDPPILGAIPDQRTFQNVPVTLTLSVSDVDTPVANLAFTGSSSNPNLVSGVSFANNGSTVAATINLVTNATGLATVTISVRDSTNNSPVIGTFALLVEQPTAEPAKLSVTRAGNVLTIGLVGTPNTTYVLEGSANLVNWTQVGNPVTANSSGVAQFTVNIAATGFQFYRARTGSGVVATINSVIETGGDNEATDTVTAKWTGVTFTNGIAGEFPNPFTVPLFGEEAPAYVDRNHQWNGAATNLAIPSYLVGGEYVMIGQDNRDNANLRLDLDLSRPALVYLLVDDRLGDANNANPPNFTTNMNWLVSGGWVPVLNGLNRSNNAAIPDEIGVDEGADGVGPGVMINQWSSIYVKSVLAGTLSLFQGDNAGQNMYGVVVKPAP